MKKGVRFKWTAECQQAFDTLKLKLMTEPILALPNDGGHTFLTLMLLTSVWVQSCHGNNSAPKES